MTRPGQDPSPQAVSRRVEYRELMRRRPGETREDAEARLAVHDLLERPRHLADWEAETIKANAHLIDLGIDQAERIDLLRSVLPMWCSYLAAEVVHGRELTSSKRLVWPANPQVGVGRGS